MSDDDAPEYTPRRRVEGLLSDVKARRFATRDILRAERKMGSSTRNYLRGYYDALELVTAEIQQCKDAEIMGITPGDGDE